MKDYAEMAAVVLYDGGWRSKDKDQLITECGFSEDKADEICYWLREFELFELDCMSDYDDNASHW